MIKKNLRQYNRVRYYQDSYLDDQYFKKTVRFVVVSNMDIKSKQAVYTYGFIPVNRQDFTDDEVMEIVDSSPMYRVKLDHMPPVKDKHRYIEHLILEDIGKNHYDKIPASHRRFFEYIR